MRIRLVHTQALLLLSAVLLTVLCMGALNAWNLRNGFSDFLASRDAERLEKFASLVSTSAEQAGGLDGLVAQGMDLRELLREFGKVQGGLPHPIPHPHPPMADAEARGFFAPPPRPPPIDSIDAFKDRVALYTPNGQPLLGKSLPPAAGPTLDRPVYVRGEVVAMVRMVKLKPVPDNVETRFLTSQYQSIVVVACVLLVASLLSALWIARRWVRPLIEMQVAAEQIAQGEFGTRLNTDRSDEIGDVMRNINQMAHALQKLEASRRQWIADMSHELRTPLTVLRGEIDALIDNVIEMSPQALFSLREEVQQLSALVDDLHLLAMADLRAIPCYFEEADAAALVAGVVQRFARRAAQMEINLTLAADLSDPIWVRWDARRIEQLLGNLLDNSLRYTDAPGQATVAVHAIEEHVVITVEDSAPSVAQHDLSRIFEPLFRADVSRNKKAGGSGLGLAICDQIAKVHHGSLRVTASSLGGLRFTLELPLMGDQSNE